MVTSLMGAISKEQYTTQAHLLLTAEYSLICEVSDFNNMESSESVVEEMTLNMVK